MTRMIQNEMRFRCQKKAPKQTQEYKTPAPSLSTGICGARPCRSSAVSWRLRPFMRGSGHVPDDGGTGFLGCRAGVLLVDGRERAEKQTADIGQDGGAAGRDAIFRQEGEEFGERTVDAFGGLEGGLSVLEGRALEGGSEIGGAAPLVEFL